MADTVIKTTILAGIRDPAGRTWRDKGHAWDRGHAHKVLAACGAPAHHYEHGPTGHVQIRVPPGVDPDRLLERLKKHPHVRYAEFDGYMETCAVVSDLPCDPLIDRPENKNTGIHRIDALGALRYGFCDPSVRIAVIDVGIRPHEDLNVAPENSWSCVGGVVANGGAANVPTAGGATHGLWTTSLVAATPNGKGIVGTGYGCTIIAIRITANGGLPVWSDTVAGINQAGNVGAHIVSMSLTTPLQDNTGGNAGPDAVAWLASLGTLMAVSAGNGGSNGPVTWYHSDGNLYAIGKDAAGQYENVQLNSPFWPWPQSNANSFPVGASGTFVVDSSVAGDWYPVGDVRSVYQIAKTLPPWTTAYPPAQSPAQSGRGSRCRVVCPDSVTVPVGTWNDPAQVCSDYSTGGIAGTSFSTPLTAGVMGLVRTENPSLTREQVYDIVQQSADAPLYPDGVPPTPEFTARVTTTWSVEYPAIPWVQHFPNSGILNAARARLTSWTTNPVNAGQVRAYLHVIRDDVYAPSGVTYDGSTTVINGPCFIDVDGYSSDPIASVELWIGGLRLYSGAARRFQATGSTSGQAQRLRIVAKTASAVADDTRSDIAVASLTCPDFDPVGIAAVTMTAPQTYLVTGKMHAGTTVALAADSGTVGGFTYTDSTSWQATVSSVLVDPATLTATTSDGVVATATTEGPGEFAAPVTFGGAVDADYSVFGGDITAAHRLAASQNAIWDPPAEGSLVYDATNDALIDAGYAESTDGPAFDAQPGASLDAEWQPQLAPSWLARVVMSGLSWVAGPFRPFTLNPETALTYRAGFGASADARVDYSTYDGFGARIGATVDAAFGEAFRDGAAFPWTASAAFDAAFTAAPPREADTDLWPRVVPLGLVAKSRRVGIVAHAHPVNLEARHG